MQELGLADATVLEKRVWSQSLHKAILLFENWRKRFEKINFVVPLMVPKA